MPKHNVPSVSQKELLDSEEWQSIQHKIDLGGVKNNPWLPLHMSWLLRKRENTLPAEYRLPKEILQALSQILIGRSLKKLGPPEKYDPEEIGIFVYKTIEEGKAKGRNTTLVAACMKAQDKFGCAAGSAEKWFYQWAVSSSKCNG